LCLKCYLVLTRANKFVSKNGREIPAVFIMVRWFSGAS
jgi:hypothetical protein